MRILIYGINYFPELTGVGKYTGEMAEWLAAQGHQVRVVTAPPHYPAWRVAKGYSPWRYSRTCQAGVEVFRCPVWLKTQPTGVERLVHLLSFALTSLPVMLAQVFWKPEVVLTIEPPLLAAPTALLVARLSGAHSWLHIQDHEVDAAFELQSLPGGGRLQRTAVGFERWLLKHFDRLSTLSLQMLERAVGKGVERERIGLFPNWVDTGRIHPDISADALRRELGLTAEDLVVLYSGNMGGKQGLDLLLAAADRLPRVQFVLCGDGTARRRLKSESCRLALANVHFLPLQPTERLGELLNLADIHALIQRDQAADLVMPSKLAGMMASGRAVIATARPGTAVATMVTASACGALVPPENVDAFVLAVQELAAAPRLRREMGRNGRNWARDYLAKGLILSQFTAQLLQLCSGTVPLVIPDAGLEEASGTLRTADVDGE
ncbi:glycosyltransferase WbuB [Gloeobacter kilaueensis]|uniref:Glycosyl transferase group 1 n=1 Tax=Gloeobacter kilaueensis (strain ATCC BAA-2537 / CCAP 1431/1 / ULC 316 / JS1) TaxID=1183438 RepID=U5QHL4_GLOK1|nr:glycosyltransferase WbuB [Gloeobacter kilaueensis]AGY58411.1 glycosyl transferase group 1 [Gloeobacter kilaueensis JS1]